MDSLADWILDAPPLWLQLAIVTGWLSFVGLLAFGLSRWQQTEPDSGQSDQVQAGLVRSDQVQSELVRKVVHIGAGNVILLAWWLKIPAWIGITASIVFSAVTLLSYRLPILPGINSVGRKSLGTFFYAVSIGVLIVLFWQQHPYYAAIGILVMTWGDGLAALVGQRLGRHPYEIWGIKKSWEGSLAMAAVSYTVCSLILLSVQGAQWQTWAIALAVAGIATLLEAFSKLGIDNLTVPIGSALIAFWLNQLL